MEIISSKDRVSEWVTSSGILEHFSFEPSFQLNHYHPGELLTSPFEKNRYLQFIVEGDVLLYDMPSEDSLAAIDSPFVRVEVIGETELIDPNFPTFFVEARSDVYTLALPLAEYRESLLDDNRFLRFVSASLTKKLSHATSPVQKLPAKEQLLRYISNADRSQPIRDMNHLSHLLHISPRQLTRALTALCEEGVLERIKKGVYKIK